MSRIEFGRIIASLRRELRNEFNEMMTQNDLADLARIPLITLQKIEQGRQANLKPEIIRNLADALDLSTFSREAFFQSSFGLNGSQLANASLGAAVLLEKTRNLLQQIQSPAFITNPFGDLILVNPTYKAMFDLQPNILNRGHLLCRYNLNRILFSPEFEMLHAMLGASYPTFARRSLLIFRAQTLKYRNHWYFLKILPELNRYPKFRQHWQASPVQNEELQDFAAEFSLEHPRFGSLHFLSCPVQSISNESEINLYCCQPLDAHTAGICYQLASDLGTEPIQFSSHLIPPQPELLR